MVIESGLSPRVSWRAQPVSRETHFFLKGRRRDWKIHSLEQPVPYDEYGNGIVPDQILEYDFAIGQPNRLRLRRHRFGRFNPEFALNPFLHELHFVVLDPGE